MERRRFLLGLGGLGGLAAAGSVGMVVGNRGGGGGAAAASDTPTRTTKKLEVRDLLEQTDVSGTVGYGNSRDLSIGAHGTVTALPAVGTVVDRGGQLAEVDGAPVVLFLGERPAWRALPPAPPTADGADVQQLEANLIALGYGKASVLGPNTTWSDATTAAVKKWQKKLGVDETGTIDLGRIVFEPAAVRIAKHVAEVGAAAGGPLLQVTDNTRSVHIDLAASRQAAVHVGDKVQVVLPSGSTTEATVQSIGTVAAAAQNGSSPTLPVEMALTDPNAAGDLDQAPVTVKVTTSSATGVLAAPVQALVALAEGGYAVELVTGATTTKLVAVTLGASAEGWVEVTGDVHAGDVVVIAP
jgi:peptidoglycan hydrolase-like protein with peptidoglycan-binding domain